MNAFKRLAIFLCLFVTAEVFAPAKVQAENLVDKVISINAKHIPLQKLLEQISRAGGFYFSYNSNIINSDSMVSLSANNMPVKQLLSQLLNSSYQYSESGNYIIIKKAAAHPVVVNSKTATQNESYIISGEIKDDRTGQRLGNASVYEKNRLVSTLTNDSGHFSLKLYSKYQTAAITISKLYYDDTTIIIQPKFNQQISITLVPADTLPVVTTISPVPVNLPPHDTLMPNAVIDSSKLIYTTTKIDSSYLHRTKIGRFLMSASQKIQDLNIGKFIAEKPYQISVVPGLSTHGKLSGQVVNDASFNILGGYNAGVHGAEMGILFNINKYNVQSAQLAGVFNITGGSVSGVQVGGVTNIVLQNVTGVQLSMAANIVQGNYNGVQVSGMLNYTRNTTTGVQAAIGANISNQKMDGIQAGVFNYTKKLHGIQVGLINIAGTSDGYSVGLINFVVHGYHKVYVSTNEVFPLNLAFKSGNANLYSILLGGIQAQKDAKLYSFGYGLGTGVKLGRFITLSPELTSQYVYRGTWHYTNLLNKLTPQINIRLNKTFSITGGPSLNVYYSDQTTDVAGYRTTVGYTNHQLFKFSNNKLSSWLGWTVGVTVF